jgi:hypothetical protein
VDDVAYRVIATPRDLPEAGEFDKIYLLGNGLASVAEAAPGDADYNGGRWEVHQVTFTGIAPTQYTNVEDLLAAEEAGEVTISQVIRRFECPLVKGEPPQD